LSQVSPARGGIVGKDTELFWSNGVTKIPNNKSQIPNKSQWPKFKIQNLFWSFGI
jgi:hypothetical protein